MSFAAGVYAGIRNPGGGSGGGGGDGQRRLFGLKKIDKGTGGEGGSGARDGKDGTGAQGAGAGTSGTGAGSGPAGGGIGGVAGCVSGGRRACAALMFHALASGPFSRNRPGVNLTNVLRKAFTLEDPKRAKRH